MATDNTTPPKTLDWHDVLIYACIGATIAATVWFLIDLFS